MKAIERTGIDYYLQVSDVELIQKVMRLLPPNPLCINIGAAMGTSALAMLEAREDATVVSIDIEDCPLETAALEQSGLNYKDRHIFIRGKSQDVGVYWRIADFVFVDGDHTYDGCFMDGNMWYYPLKPGGYMAFHDYGDVRPTLHGVTEATDKVAWMFDLEKIDHVGTLIVFRKPEQ